MLTKGVDSKFWIKCQYKYSPGGAIMIDMYQDKDSLTVVTLILL